MFLGHFAFGFIAQAVAGLKGSYWVPSLWLCFVATQLVDVFHMIFVLADFEILEYVQEETGYLRLELVYVPITHSLFTNVIYFAFFIIAAMVTAIVIEQRDRKAANSAVGVSRSDSATPQLPQLDPLGDYRHPRTSFDYFSYILTLGVLMGSHWLGDWIVHTPDLPYYPLLDKSDYATQDKAGLGMWYIQSLSFTFELCLTLGTYVWMRVRNPVSPALVTLGPLQRFAHTPLVKNITLGDILVVVTVCTLVFAQFVFDAPSATALAILSLVTYVGFSVLAFFLWDRPIAKARRLARKSAAPMQALRVIQVHSEAGTDSEKTTISSSTAKTSTASTSDTQ